MKDPNLIADLVRAGVDADLVGRVAGALLAAMLDASAERRQTSADASADSSTDKRRQRDREYQRKRRQNRNNSKANDVEFDCKTSADASADSSADSGNEPNESFFLSSTEIQRSKEEKSSRRGTRLNVGDICPAEYFDWAFAEGLSIDQIGKIWTEFVDYWAAIPGQRGTKLDWFATFRNRVRQIRQRGQNGKQTNGSRLMEALDHAIDRAGGSEIGGDHKIRDITPRCAEPSQATIAFLAPRKPA